eukprot:4263089-Ditylum_brightwellii.AAC.1
MNSANFGLDAWIDMCCLLLRGSMRQNSGAMHRHKQKGLLPQLLLSLPSKLTLTLLCTSAAVVTHPNQASPPTHALLKRFDPSTCRNTLE